jgi:hypothetical protein
VGSLPSPAQLRWNSGSGRPLVLFNEVETAGSPRGEPELRCTAAAIGEPGIVRVCWDGELGRVGSIAAASAWSRWKRRMSESCFSISLSRWIASAV